MSSRALTAASGRTTITEMAAAAAQAVMTRRPYRASSTVTACAATTSRDSSFR